MRGLLIATLAFFASTQSFGFDKVAHIYGPITETSAVNFLLEITSTSYLPGDRRIVIDSPGGDVDAGMLMLRLIGYEQSLGVRIVCEVERQASSMAFNILSHCNRREAHPKSKFLTHKIAAAQLNPLVRWTAKFLQSIVDDLNRYDEPFRQANAAALHITPGEYDVYADNETVWTAQQLLQKGYLSQILP